MLDDLLRGSSTYVLYDMLSPRASASVRIRMTKTGRKRGLITPVLYGAPLFTRGHGKQN